MEPKDIFIGKARKYNHFDDSGMADAGHSCATCVRRHFAYPYTCSDGWLAGTKQLLDRRGALCRNWTDDPKTPVD
jgi:hypothetical protein